MDYPLYDVPWLVRDPNAYRMSAKRHQIEVRNQAVVDDYFVARAFTISSFGFIEKRKKEENSIFVKNFSLPMEH